MEPISEFIYRIPGRPGTSRPGAHRSPSRGPGLDFSHYARLMDYPDPRRLDLRASLNDIRGDWLVRATKQQSATNILVMIDVSASMLFGAKQSKLSVAANFVESLGHSAFRNGDAVGLCAFDGELREDLSTPARMGRGVGTEMANQLRSVFQQHPSLSTSTMDAHTLTQCALSINNATSLVFLVSDFHWPLEHLELLLSRSSQVRFVPLIIWDSAEVKPPLANRWLRTNDMETGKQSSLWLSAASRQRWIDNIENRRNEIKSICTSHHLQPLYLENGFDAESLTRYFMETAL